MSSSKTKTHRRYIQDIVSFLKHEAVKEEEDVKYEHKTVGSDHVVRVTLAWAETRWRPGRRPSSSPRTLRRRR